MTITYDQGQGIQCVGIFTDPDDTTHPLDPQTGKTLVDPDVVKFVALKGDRTTYLRYTYGTDSELVRVSQGVYRVTLSADVSGPWQYRFYSTGTGEASARDTFSVDADALV